MPGDAIATLRLLSSRLRGNVTTELKSHSTLPTTLDIVDHVASLAESAADGLQEWVTGFCDVSEKAVSESTRLEPVRRGLLQLQWRTYLDVDVDPDQIKRWGRSGLESWLGTSDTVSSIRQRLFFSITAEQARASVTIRSFIGQAANFSTVAEAADAVDGLSRALALAVPEMRIAGVLATTDPDRRQKIGRALVRPDVSPRQVLLVTPQTTGLTSEERNALEDFESKIPQPANQAPRQNQSGDDHSAVRRVELAEILIDRSRSTERLNPFVEMADSLAEATRRRAEQKYQMVVTPLPPRLRLAVGQTAAFRSFAHAYRAGYIVRRLDQSGLEQWFLTAANQFLTFGQQQSLGHAAANYTRDVKNHPDTIGDSGTKGDFSALAQWTAGDRALDDNVFALLAIDVCEE
jgi:hypothetical protein